MSQGSIEEKQNRRGVRELSQHWLANVGECSEILAAAAGRKLSSPPASPMTADGAIGQSFKSTQHLCTSFGTANPLQVYVHCNPRLHLGLCVAKPHELWLQSKLKKYSLPKDINAYSAVLANHGCRFHTLASALRVSLRAPGQFLTRCTRDTLRVPILFNDSPSTSAVY